MLGLDLAQVAQKALFCPFLMDYVPFGKEREK